MSEWACSRHSGGRRGYTSAKEQKAPEQESPPEGPHWAEGQKGVQQPSADRSPGVGAGSQGQSKLSENCRNPRSRGDGHLPRNH